MTSAAVGPFLRRWRTVLWIDPQDQAAWRTSAEPAVLLLLLDRAGRAFRPSLPLGPCQTPREEANATLQDLAVPGSTTDDVRRARLTR